MFHGLLGGEGVWPGRRGYSCEQLPPSHLLVPIRSKAKSELQLIARSVKSGIALAGTSSPVELVHSVAERETGVFVRRLDGRVERGRLVDGVFKGID